MIAKCIALLLACTASIASACKPGRSVDVMFEKNSAAMSASQYGLLADWVADIQHTFPHHELIALGVNAEQGETDAENLGRQRELAVRLALINLDLTAPQFYSPEKVKVVKPGAYGEGPRNDVKRVEIDYVPACPHACGGCPAVSRP